LFNNREKNMPGQCLHPLIAEFGYLWAQGRETKLLATSFKAGQRVTRLKVPVECIITGVSENEGFLDGRLASNGREVTFPIDSCCKPGTLLLRPESLETRSARDRFHRLI
jgi:hypothetical protein